jgi:hypothetical protein
LNVWGGCGADLVQLRGVGSCDGFPLWCIDPYLEADECLRVGEGGRDGDGTEDSSFTLGCTAAGADGLGCVTGGPSRCLDRAFGALLKKFPMGIHERLSSDQVGF